MPVADIVARAVLSGIFLVFAADYVFHFMPALPFTEQGGRYLEALIATGYMFPLIKSVEVISALLILSGRYTALGLLVALPVLVNIALYHIVLDPNGSSIAAALVLSEGWLIWRYRRAYAALWGTRRPAHEGVVAQPLGHAAATRP